MRVGDWIDDDPFYGRVEGVRTEAAARNPGSPAGYDGGGIAVTMREPGDRAFTTVIMLDPHDHFTIVPEPGGDPLGDPHPYERDGAA